MRGRTCRITKRERRRTLRTPFVVFMTMMVPATNRTSDLCFVARDHIAKRIIFCLAEKCVPFAALYDRIIEKGVVCEMKLGPALTGVLLCLYNCS